MQGYIFVGEGVWLNSRSPLHHTGHTDSRSSLGSSAASTLLAADGGHVEQIQLLSLSLSLSAQEL
jgi:hypothetical protein